MSPFELKKLVLGKSLSFLSSHTPKLKNTIFYQLDAGEQHQDRVAICHIEKKTMQNEDNTNK